MKIGASWRSTLTGCISAGGMFLAFASAPPYNVHFPTWVMAIAGFMAVGGVASLGINAKDSGVTGGTIVQPGIPVAPAETVMVSASSLVPTALPVPPPPQTAATSLRKW